MTVSDRWVGSTMKTDAGCMSHRRIAVAVLSLMMAAGIASAKSMYVIAKIIAFDSQIPVHVYDIGADGLLTYQTQFGAPFIGAGMVGICMDSDSGYLFSTYEDSGFVLVTNAATLEKRAVLGVSAAKNLAGIVYDHQKKLLYCAEMGQETLHVLNWNSLTGKITPVVGSPFALKGAMIYGIALDEYADLLYVASPSQGISVYSTYDWSLVRTELAEAIAISIAVDPERDYLYYGGGFADNYNLTRRKISDRTKKEVEVDPEAGVMGLGVDPDSGLVYITTGRDNRPGGKDLMVYNSELELLQVIEDIGRPTGLAIPFRNTSFNPLHLAKTVENPLGGKANSDGLFYVTIGDLVTYTISFDDGGLDPTEISVIDKLPAQVTFVGATGLGAYARYDSTAHTVTWTNPSVTVGQTTTLEVVCRVKMDTPAGQIITNRVTIDSDKTPPSTVSVGAVATEAIYNPLNFRKVVVSPVSSEDDSILYARPGDEIAYRILFDNKDNDRTVSNIVIVDALPQGVEFVRATGDGSFGAYNPQTRTYTWIYASLPGGGSESVDLVVRLADNITPGTVVANRATIRSDQTPETSKGADVTVAYEPLEVVKTVLNPAGGLDDRGRACVGAGEKITYQITVRNPARDVAVSQILIQDELPREITFVTADGNGDIGFYDSVTHTFTWSYSLLAAGEQVSLKLEGYVSEAIEPNTVLVNAVTVTSKQAAPTRAQAEAIVYAGWIEAQMFLKPTILWRNSSQATPDLMVVVHLPEGYGMETILDTPLTLTPGDVQSTTPKIYGTSQQGKILCFFDTAALLAATQGYGQFDIQVAGRLTGGRSFVCKGKVSILRFGGP
ncbi:MAG TPA: DUF11 domain-containing protein [Sedimentisphaerales bacterium]|nr:DUF11 domain-containing protein [Sedimentisphaerales bacterium]